MRHATAEHRAIVTPRADAERVAERLRALFARRPTDRVERKRAASLIYREEPPWFLAMWGVSTCLLGMLGAVANTHVPVAAWSAWALVVVLEVVAGFCLARVAVAVLVRVEIRAERERVVLCRRIGRRAWGRREVDPFAVTGVLVVRRRGARRVVVAGARNEELATAYSERWADPPALAVWWADAVAAVIDAAATDVERVERDEVRDAPTQDEIASAPLRE
jgi:hypothetical protein